MSSEGSPETSPLSVKLRVDTPAEPILTQAQTVREEAARRRVGSRVKGWRLVKLLGVGPLSSAYEVIHGDKDSGERGVMRILTGEAARSERARSQFLRSAYAANRFRHPRVVPVTSDGADDDGVPYVIRNFVETRSLATALEELRAEGSPGMPEAKVLRLMEQLLDALEIAHAHGVVHGAIGPANVLVTTRGSVRLVDFATPPGSLLGGSDTRDALADLRVGPFAAPERCSLPPEAATEQTDVWAVAACAYFALSGKFPRGSDTSRAELATREPVPLREVAPEASDPVALILDHALQTEPERRYGSAYAMLGDVRRALAGRKPKLGDALRPVPSGSYRDVSVPSSRRVLLAADRPQRAGYSAAPAAAPSSASRQTRKKNEWRGNMVLILAIAMLVGVATFVVVRERVEEQRRTAPSESR